MTRARKTPKTERPRNRLPSDRLHASSLGNELDQSLYRVLKIIKDRSGNNRYTVFDPVLTAEEYSRRVLTLIRIEKGVFQGIYTGRPWRFIKHVNTAFDFILATKSKKTKVHMQTLEFRDVFHSQMDEIMENLGYCCGTWYNHKARRVNCTGTKGCMIPQGEVYFRYCEWTYCLKCFQNSPGNFVNAETVIGRRIIRKEHFLPYYFEIMRPERFVYCELCGFKFHEICVNYCLFNVEPFICDKCKRAVGLPTINLRASILPETQCDRYINSFLQKQNINLNGQITIRLLTDVRHELQVPDKFRQVRSGPKMVVYRNCTLFTFFNTGSDTDICFFSVFFQLFGENCQDSNRNSVYISYIDSVNFLPENRTLIYRLVLLGLFEFLQSKGYTKIYLWSCPPTLHQDYIFYMKPPKMKMPTAARLAKWYRELLETGLELGVINSYQGIQETSKDLNGLPYMDGDLWVTRLSEAIDTVNKERGKDCNEITKLRARLTRESRHDKREETLKQIESLRLKILENTDDKLWELMTVQIQHFNREYFVINLTEKAKVVEETFIGNQLAKSQGWLNDRHLFMDFFWGHILEFSSERRARYSSFVMLWKILVENSICANCEIRKEGGVNGQVLCRTCDRLYQTCINEIENI